MIPNLRRFLMVFILVGMCLSIFIAPKAHSTDSTFKERAIAFVTDVAELDMAKYSIKDLSESTNKDLFDDNTLNTLVSFVLEAEGSNLETSCMFVNDTFTGCNIRPLNASQTVLMAQASSSVLDSAKRILERYQANLVASYVQPMRDVLNSVSELHPLNASSNEVTLSIELSSTNAGDDVTFIWSYNAAGITNIRKAVRLSFLNGFLRGFSDKWDLYEIGNTDVEVSEQEARSMALELAKNYKLQMNVGPNKSWVDVPFQIDESRTEVSLSMISREPFVLYPFWHIKFHFDKVYYSATGIEVGIWADTGHVEYCSATGISGTSSNGADEDSNTPLPPLSISQLTVIGIVIAVLVGAGLLVYFKKRKR